MIALALFAILRAEQSIPGSNVEVHTPNLRDGVHGWTTEDVDEPSDRTLAANGKRSVAQSLDRSDGNACLAVEQDFTTMRAVASRSTLPLAASFDEEPGTAEWSSFETSAMPGSSSLLLRNICVRKQRWSGMETGLEALYFQRPADASPPRWSDLWGNPEREFNSYRPSQFSTLKMRVRAWAHEAGMRLHWLRGRSLFMWVSGPRINGGDSVARDQYYKKNIKTRKARAHR